MSFSSTLDRPEATTYSVDDLLRDVKNGKIKIPRFQRQFRWESEDMLKLLDSIYRGYPIGNLLFWETDSDQKAKSVIGPDDIEETAKVTKLIIDGQQRITTLVGIFLLPDDDDSDKKWHIYFDLKTKKFEIPKQKTKVPYYWIPLREVFDTVRFLTWLRTLPVTKESEGLIHEANQLSKSLRDYKIPAYIVRTDDEKILREIFERLNKGGKPLTDTEVFNSLFGRTDDTEPDDLSAVRKEFERYGFGSIKENDLLKSLQAVLGIDINIKFDKVKDLLKQKDERTIHKTITELHDVLKTVADFLEKDAGICHISLLPYPFSLRPLIKFFYLFRNPSDETRKELSRWLWRATTSGFFYRITAQPIKKIFTSIKDTESQTVERLTEISKDFSYPEIKTDKYIGLGNASTKIFCNYLISLNPKNFINGEQFEAKPIIEEEGLNVFQKFTKINGSDLEVKNKVLEEGFCNRFFYPASKSSEISKNMMESDGSVLQSHAIPPAIAVYWRKGEIEEFLKRRQSFIKEDMNRYLEERRGQI